MSNKLIIAAAGSGKTTHLVNEALKITNSKVLITTFTEANEQEIKKKFYNINGSIPENINIQTWFSFLLQHGVKPYQSVLYDGDIKGLLLVNAKSGLRFKNAKGIPIYFGEDDTKNYYFSKSKLIYSDKLSKFVFKVDELTNGQIIKRIEKIYSHIFIDEIQDMAGYDLDIIKLLFLSNVNILLVGDPRQVTYHTHDEKRHKKYSDGNITDFVEHECKKCHVEIDNTTLNKTYRNNKAICDFANTIFSNYMPCESVEHNLTGHDGVFFILPKDIDKYLSIYHPMQLRNTRKTNVNARYPAMNLGESKGLTFDRVLIYPTSTMIDWILNTDKKLPTQSRSKLYVGVTRAKHSVAIVFDNKKGISIHGIKNYCDNSIIKKEVEKES